MVLALNREKFVGIIEIIGCKRVQEWPDAEEVIAERSNWNIPEQRSALERAKLLGQAPPPSR